MNVGRTICRTIPEIINFLLNMRHTLFWYWNKKFAQLTAYWYTIMYYLLHWIITSCTTLSMQTSFHQVSGHLIGDRYNARHLQWAPQSSLTTSDEKSLKQTTLTTMTREDERRKEGRGRQGRRATTTSDAAPTFTQKGDDRGSETESSFPYCRSWECFGM